MIEPSDATGSALARAVEGQFRLEREIGRGGMGVVYLATDVQLERHVALKTLPPHLAADAAVRGRFVREARTAAALSHPNIVPIHHAAERDGVVYFAMGYVPGDSLADRIARAPLTEAELLPVLVELADALGYAHGRGVVHRDVKAENVLIDSRTGRAMVTDFGIARVTEAQPLTATGTVLGTVHYMSPEQVLGESLDGRSDLYALGILAFYATTGRFPFERGNAPAVLVAHVNNAAPRIHEYNPDASDRLDAIVARLLEKRPDDRFASAGALRAALLGEMDGMTARVASRAAEAAPRDAIARVAPVGRPLTMRGAAPSAQPMTAAPAVLSSEEAQQVWARAAELQANTGVLTPPPAFELRRADSTGDAASDGLAATRGYDASLVRASAEDAGIPARYVDRAMAEREAMRPVLVQPGDTMMKPANPLSGARTKLEFNAEIEGELDDIGFEEVADEIRSALGEMVTVSAVGRTLTVSTAGGSGGRGPGKNPRMLQLHVSSRNGRTVVRGFEDLTNIAVGTFGGLMGGLGMGGGMAIMGSMLAHGGGVVAVGSWLSVLATSYGAARLIFVRSSRRKERELKETVERVVVCARRYVVRR